MTEPQDDPMDELREHVRTDLRMGFVPVEDIAESVMDLVETDDADEMLAVVEELVRSESEAFRREQAGWPAVTDCDRLDLAFQELERRGIVARHHFSCCMNCGSREIWGEVDDAADAGMQARGYAFYHEQDTARAADGGGLFLAYGAFEDDAKAAVGHEVAAVLHAQGLTTEWDGSPDRRIQVTLDWKRRRDDL
jgi:hypothetical protein